MAIDVSTLILQKYSNKQKNEKLSSISNALSMEKIPAVKRPVIKLSVKSMALIGTQSKEKSRNLGI